MLIAGLELKKSNPLMNAWMVKEVDAPYQQGIETINGSHFVVPAGAEGPLRPPEGWAPIKASPSIIVGYRYPETSHVLNYQLYYIY